MRVGNMVLDASDPQPARTTSEAVAQAPPKERKAKIPTHADQPRRDHQHPQGPHRGTREGEADLSEVGTVLSIADGIARVHGLDNCMSLEMLELPHDVTGLALNLESDNVGAVLFGEWDKIEEGDTVKRTGRLLEIPVGEGLLGRIVDPLGNPLDGKGEVDTTETRPAEFKAPGVVAASAGDRADADRHQGHRRDDPDRPRPARADHRRPPDRQDGDRARHDHQQQGQGPGLHLRRDRAADVRRSCDVGRRRSRSTARSRTRSSSPPPPTRPRRSSTWRPTPARDGRVLPLQGQARALRLRRPDEARLRVPPDVAAAAPPAGPRGLPGRRLLPALAPAGARGEAERRARRRLAHGAADDRDAGGRRVGLHPDQRHLDHRRPDLPRGRPVPLGRAAGHQRRASRCRAWAATRRPSR